MAPSRSRKGGDAHRKNNHPKRAFRQVRLDVEGLDLLPVRTGAVRDFDGYQEVERRAHRFSRVALKRGHQAVVLQTGGACPYLVGSGCFARSGGARGCDGFGLVACPNVPENRGDDVGVLDAGDDTQRTAALRASLYIDGCLNR